MRLLETQFYLETLEVALGQETPEIFNLAQEVSEEPDFYFGYDFKIDVLEIDCDGANCP